MSQSDTDETMISKTKPDIGVVLTADLVNSTAFPPEETERRLGDMLARLKTGSGWLLTPEVYRGDSFQGVLKSGGEALRISLLARAILKAENSDLDLRIALGIGELGRLTDRPGTSDGEAFRLSGQLADVMKKEKARIAAALPAPSEPVKAMLTLLESVVEKWTSAQAEVTLRLLTGATMSEIAEALRISQPAVSQHAQAAKWWAVEPVIHTFDQLIQAFLSYD